MVLSPFRVRSRSSPFCLALCSFQQPKVEPSTGGLSRGGGRAPLQDNSVSGTGLGYEEAIKSTAGGIYGPPLNGTKKVRVGLRQRFRLVALSLAIDRRPGGVARTAGRLRHGAQGAGSASTHAKA